MAVAVDKASEKLKELDVAGIYYKMLEKFKEKYPDEANVWIVRAPGRVNIIGEHTDYNGLPVFPMAIDREIIIVFAANELGKVELYNIKDSYPSVEFDISTDIPHYEMGHWGNYAKAAAQAVAEWANANCPEKLPLPGIKGIVGGSIPAGSGLSSSSALVVAVASALSKDLPIAKPDLADLLAKGERYVGTEGGGMDQAASLLNKQGYATKIDFMPLETKPVKLPEGYVIVIANTMVSAKKTGGARNAYNTRVAECRLGLEMLKHDVRDDYPIVDNATYLKHFMQMVNDWDDAIANLPDGPLTISEIAAYVELPEEELAKKCLTQRDGNRLPIPEGGFKPKERVRHVLTEANRVELTVSASEDGDAIKLGKLMDESHSSCANDYEISCPELDKLVGELRKSGALGARLTGAGFGGCTVSLVKAENAQPLMDNVWKEYYESYLPGIGINTPKDRDAVLFSCSPAEGAGVLI